MDKLTEHHEPHLFFFSVAIVILCILDAVFTLILIKYNLAVEANPIMDVAMKANVLVFFVIKMLVTSVCLVISVVLKQEKLLNTVSGASILYGTFVGYCALIAWELHLLGVLGRLFS